MTLNRKTRDAIGRTVAKLRRLFEEEFGQQARARFGLHSEERASVDSDADVSAPLRKHVESESALSLSPTQRWQRGELLGALEYLVGEGASGAQAVERLLREASFTAVNRLLAIRVAEAIGALPEVMGAGRKSAGYRETVGDLFPILATAEDEGFWTYLQVCGDELGASVPLLFDRRSPVTAFVPGRTCIEEALTLVNDPEVVPAWGEPEALGWAYQFFNTDTERQDMRAESQAPRNSRELAVRNQFFTPRYVVDWLVQNTLGRRLVESGYDLDLPLLVGGLASQSEQLELTDVCVFDPACGSGHFLVGAYDLLEAAWTSTGVAPPDAAPSILASLYGVDIDHRAVQVAQAVLVLRARRSGAHGVAPPTIVTARDLPRGQHLRRRLSEVLPSPVGDIVDQLDDALRDVPVLGTLLTVEELLQESLKDRVGRPQLTDDPVDGLQAAEDAVLEALSAIASETGASASERMFAADGKDAIRFVELVQRRYDAILMNPPFGAPVPATRSYLKGTYGKSAVDLFSAFVDRGLRLSKPDGYVGAITNRTGFFLKTFAGWRQESLLPHVVCAADLGHGVLQDALVEAATYVLASGTAPDQVHVRGLLREKDKSRLADPDAGASYVQRRRAFADLPNATLSYWVAPSILHVFADCPRFADVGDARQGLATADDFRFVRLWWEVPPQASASEQHWFPFAKGGEYAPWYADLHLVVDWEHDGKRIKDTGQGRPQNTDAYFKPALTWSLRTASGFTVRALPAGCIFSHKGCYVAGKSLPELAAWANSRVTRYLIELQLAAGETTVSGGAARSYEVGIIQELPYPTDLPDFVAGVGREQVELELRASTREETSRHFVAWSDETGLAPVAQARRLEALEGVDRAISHAYGLDEDARRAVDEEVGPAPASYGRDVDLDPAEVRGLYALPMQQLVNHVLEQCGGARYVATKSHLVDRRLELVCHLYRVHPRVIAEIVDDVEPADAAQQRARMLISYLVGVAFGRWDVRLFGRAADLPDPWAPFPPTPPGMHADETGRPSRRVPSDYPLQVPSQPLLHDDPGHEWDISARVDAAAEQLPDGHQRLDMALREIGARDLHSYLRGSFFSDHLASYSDSRRQAPIYWRLAVPSNRWGVWLYYPDLTREVLFAVASAGEEKMRRTTSLVNQLSEDMSSGSPARQGRERLEQMEELREELRIFIERVQQVAQSGWDPDLNDGAVLCAAPLEPLFQEPSWLKHVTKQRKDLENGAYPWAGVQQGYFWSDE